MMPSSVEEYTSTKSDNICACDLLDISTLTNTVSIKLISVIVRIKILHIHQQQELHPPSDITESLPLMAEELVMWSMIAN